MDYAASLLVLFLLIASLRGESLHCEQCKAEGDVLNCQNHDCLEMPQIKDESKLRVVNMSRNRLYKFDGGMFQELETLDLSENNLMRDDNLKLNDMLKLTYLNLASNRLDETILFGKAFLGTSISVLNLSRNRMGFLNQSSLLYVELKPTLTELDLSHNRIKGLHQEAITDLTELQKLHLDGNLISDLHKTHFMGLRSLSYLNISGNRLSEIEDYLFQGCENLRILDLSHNSIDTLTPESFKQHFTSLEELHLQHNKINHIYEGLFNIHTLKYINLDNNKLRTIDSFSFGSGLTSISIQHSIRLKEIVADVFHHSTKLSRIMVANNDNLVYISSRAFSDQIMEADVILANNSIAKLPVDLFHWKNSTDVDLTGNYWDCDCNLAWIISYEFRSSVV